MSPVWTPRRKVVWIDANGYVWHLSGDRAGEEGAKMAPSPKGLDDVEESVLVDEGQHIEGAIARGRSVAKRDMDFTVHLTADTPRALRVLKERWRSGWSATKPGHWCEFTSSGGWRWRSVLRAGEQVPAFKKDDALICRATYHVPALAAWPWWTGFEISAEWSTTANVGEGALTLVNPCSEDLTWEATLAGPGTYSITDGPGGPWVELPTLPSGWTMRVDTSTTRPTVIGTTAAGELVNLWGQMRGRRFTRASQLPAARGLTPSQTVLGIRIEGGNGEAEALIEARPKYRSGS